MSRLIRFQSRIRGMIVRNKLQRTKTEDENKFTANVSYTLYVTVRNSSITEEDKQKLFERYPLLMTGYQ